MARRISPQRSDYLETTSIGSKKKREIPTKIVNEEPPHSDEMSRGAGLTNDELQDQRNHNFNLAPAKNR